MASGGSFSVDLGSQVQSRVAVNGTLGDFVSKGFSAVILVAALASFLYLVLGGVEWLTSGGEKGKLEEARNRITSALIGLAIVASAWAVFRLVDYFFGIGITQ